MPNEANDKNAAKRTRVTKSAAENEIIGQSALIQELLVMVQRIADHDTTVMIHGESGTGKEMFARALHNSSSRRNNSFVAINCAAIPENLLESELFGHKRGAFTDATRDSKGLFEEADGGTILLDEIGELPLQLQVKLLRVIQEGEIRPVGDTKSLPINVRIVSATHRDLEAEILAGRFREDLFYRLNVISLTIPPLRERRSDIELLAEFFIKKNSVKLGSPVRSIAPDALTALTEYSWPGNIRELENCIERATIMSNGDVITRESLPKNIVGTSAQTAEPMSISEEQLSIKHHSRILEQNLIRLALKKTGGNRTHAAKLLEVSHRTLLYKLKDYGMEDL